MSWLSPRPWLLLAPLALALGCGPVSNGSSGGGTGQLLIQATYEKPALSPSGFGASAYKPARYCFAEVRRSSDGFLLADGYLGSDGRGSVDVDLGTTFYVRVFAAVEVPATSGSGFFFRGSVLNGSLPIIGEINPAETTTEFDARRASDFQSANDWVVESNDYTANGDLTLDVTAHAGTSDTSAGGFAIADQMVSLAAQVRDLDPTLRLPDLHPYWSPATSLLKQRRTYPSALFNGSAPYKLSATGRAVFTASLYSRLGSAADTENDAFDDAVVQETLNHLLFADYSYKEDGSSVYSLLRRDNDPVYVSRTHPSESTAGFVGGFSDFLAAAVTGDSRLMDSYNNGSGLLQVDTFDLASHTQIPLANRSEFTRGSVAISLWGSWKHALGGGQPGLQLLWNAARSTTPAGVGYGEYEAATLGCYPSYLLGVKSRATGTQWTDVVTELTAESIPEPVDAYFFPGTALWEHLTVGGSVSSSVAVYDATLSRYYDRDQSQAFRFVQGATATRTVTMTPTSGQDLYLEVLGPGGWIAGSYGSPGSTRTLTLTNLAPGAYAIRVRAGATTATTTAGFDLTLN